MPRLNIVRMSNIIRTPRVVQLESLFDVPKASHSQEFWKIELPIEDFPWNIGLIVGPSGSGKSTLLKEAFGPYLIPEYQWNPEKSIVDSFPAHMSIKEITMLLSSVGFSSPPSWLRPFHVLSNGEKFRVTIARALAENQEITVIDEFTSVVDRTVAQIGSAAIARTIRKRQQKFIAASCHYDIIEWLEPDWIYEPHLNKFQRVCLQRPQIQMEVKRVDKSAWD
ncbi:MAG: ATP-binding cassette domain-containing protein, partial [Deltaproteobacteria bacterium]|nr:ATP-binding cassette domain-containing protein [Deltaproteobacteria bacterium]